MTRRVPLVLILLASAIGACQFLLPERFAVNAPMLHSLFGRGVDAPLAATIRDRIRVPEGLSASLYAEGISNARNLLFAPNGDLLVSRPRAGEIVVLSAAANDAGRAADRRTLIGDLKQPYGMAIQNGWLYVAEADGIGRFAFDADSTTVTGPIERLVTGIPSGGNHWTRNIHFGPDGWLYLTVGSSCNVCVEEDPRRAAMVRYRPDGTGEELHATGLRNAVDFDWQPGTGTLYATDNGRDLLGDDFPPCELNAVVAGGFYGWPYANGDKLPDPDFGEGQEARIANSIAPAHPFAAHNAPLGITFLRSPNAPAGLRGAAIVALHGSWNRTSKDGYKVVSLHWDETGRISERDFMTGFEVDDDVIGRPAHVAEGPDGAIYISDDYAGVIWRVAAEGAPTRVTTAAPATPVVAGAEVKLEAGALERGAALYAGFACASCHETQHAAPDVVVKELAGLQSRYDQRSLAELLATPPPPMPTFDMDEIQRLEVSAYLRARFK